MSYVTHKWPRPRAKDTPLGKIMGYVSELLFWADQEGKCSTVDALWPEVWPIDWVDDVFINIFKDHYNKNYQGQYNRGADQGNKMNKEIMGWLDDLKDKAFAEVDRVKKYIETNLIQPLQTDLNRAKNTLKQLGIDVDSLESDIRKTRSDVADTLRDLSSHTKDIRELFDRVKSLEAQAGRIPRIEELLKIG